MAKGQGRSSGQGVKLLYIRDYLYTHATKEHPKNAKDISKYLASMGVSASVKTIYNDFAPANRFWRSNRIQSLKVGVLHHAAAI